MSTEKLEAYKELYSKYVEYSLNLHNYHYQFIQTNGLDSGKQIRVSLEFMYNLCKEMKKANMEAYKENRENTKEERARLREIRANAKPRVMPRGKSKGTKNGINIRTTDSSI